MQPTRPPFPTRRPRLGPTTTHRAPGSPGTPGGGAGCRFGTKKRIRPGQRANADAIRCQAGGRGRSARRAATCSTAGAGRGSLPRVPHWARAQHAASTVMQAPAIQGAARLLLSTARNHRRSPAPTRSRRSRVTQPNARDAGTRSATGRPAAPYAPDPRQAGEQRTRRDIRRVIAQCQRTAACCRDRAVANSRHASQAPIRPLAQKRKSPAPLCERPGIFSFRHPRRGRRLGDYFSIVATTPAPTVRPPSRIVKRWPMSMAIGAISLTPSATLSPGMTISVPSGSSMVPVTSVVRK